MLIDFDDKSTFPEQLSRWDFGFEKWIRENVSTENISEWWQIEHQLRDLRIGETDFVRDFVHDNLDCEVAVCHCARILDEKQYWREGIVTGGGKDSVADKRLRKLLADIGLNQAQIEEIFTHVYYLWGRDKTSRTDAVHFFVEKKLVYEDDCLNNFAINLGGEILRWSLESVGDGLYRTEPYKRLWIDGIPSIIKFKCKLSSVHEVHRYNLIAQIVEYYIMKNLYGYEYEFDFTGMTIGSVPPEDIISIEEIKDFTKMQEKYPEYQGFYE